MTPKPSDFLQVQLSAAGVAFAGAAGVVRFGNGHFSYTFKRGESVRVLTSEWSRVLSIKQFNGSPILEEVAASSTPAAKPSNIAGATRTISPAVSHMDPPEQSTQPAKAADAEVK